MRRSRWGPAAVVALAAAVVPAGAAVTVTPGQEFLYTGTVELKQSVQGGPDLTITGPLKLSALVAEADPGKGYAVVLMRSFQPEAKQGQPRVPGEVAVTTVRYGADLAPAGAPGAPPGLISQVMQRVPLPLAPRAELKTGDEWRKAEPLPLMPPRPLEQVSTVAGETKVGDHSCLKVEKKLAQSLPLKQDLGGATLEVTDYGQTLCVDPGTGQVWSHELHQHLRQSGGGRQVEIDLKVAVTLQEIRQVQATDLAARVKQAETLDRVQRALFTPRSSADRKQAVVAAGKELAALRKDYPDSPYAPAIARLDQMVAGVREQAEREARLQGLKDKPAPDFTLKNLAGKEQTLGAYRGKLILLNFFASW